ncbi:exosortase family protein XrtF [Rasiella sp. SM2506]|uniref:exosortase family protein XrtF n=1 Tax=Rasiella sp. SM2506 TaxID=3423914 RepID=UPI003D7A7702
MKKLFSTYKSVVVFLLLFLGSYVLLSLLYGFYLELSKNGRYAPDFITNLVAKQSTAVIEGFGYFAQVIPHPTQPSMKLFVEGRFLARIVEGCNALSIIILFVSFIIAFAQRWKKTVLYIFSGVLLIYAVNILRIAMLAMALYKYPEHQHTLHSVVFPGIIYGMVFLLWLVWVRMLTPKSPPE